MLIISIISATCKVAYTQESVKTFTYEYMSKTNIKDSVREYNSCVFHTIYNDSSFAFSSGKKIGKTSYKYSTDSFRIENKILKIYTGKEWVNFFDINDREGKEIAFVNLTNRGELFPAYITVNITKYKFIDVDSSDEILKLNYDIYSHNGVVKCSNCLNIENDTIKKYLNMITDFDRSSRVSFNPLVGYISTYYYHSEKGLTMIDYRNVYQKNKSLLKEISW